ncbi:MAG TPA: hypothetical protein VFS00_18000, partial [Polyangiaceae bacterium]|nr:hypothetical protein [Polyangiaceae bacterium]
GTPLAHSQGRGESYFEDHNVNELRREVHRPQRASFPRPMTAVEKADTALAPPPAPKLRAVATARSPVGLGTAQTQLAGVAHSAAQKATSVARPSPLLQKAAPAMRKVMSTITPVLKHASLPAEAVFAELVKIGAISEQQARAALDRYELAQATRPTAPQVARYGVLGAASGPVIGAVGDAISGRPLLGGGNPKARLRSAVGSAAMGALGSGAIPLVRSRLDQQAEKKVLRGYLNQGPTAKEARANVRALLELIDGIDERVRTQVGSQAAQAAVGKLREKDSAMSGITPARRMSEDYPAAIVKAGFQTSAYDGGIGRPTAPQVSQVPAFRVPSLRAVVEKKEADDRGAKLLVGGLTAALGAGLAHKLWVSRGDRGKTLDQIEDELAVEDAKKSAASAPTRGNFM